MRKIILSFGFLSVLFPSISFGALTITPSTYETPANVSFSGGNGANKIILYSTTTASTAYCGVSARTSGNLNSDCDQAQVTPGVADFAGTLADGWMFIQPTQYDCSNSVSYATCKSNNPAAEEADFVINSTTTGQSTSSCYGNCIMSSSTDAIIGDVGNMLYLILAMIIFFGSAWIVFKQLK